MAPEYATEGHFEYATEGHFLVKSNVFIFEVLVFEIVTGKKNRGFYNVIQQVNLVEQVSVKFFKRVSTFKVTILCR